MISGIKLKISGMLNRLVKVRINARRLPETCFYGLCDKTNIIPRACLQMRYMSAI